jgi:hypothetical protein
VLCWCHCNKHHRQIWLATSANAHSAQQQRSGRSHQDGQQNKASALSLQQTHLLQHVWPLLVLLQCRVPVALQHVSQDFLMPMGHVKAAVLFVCCALHALQQQQQQNAHTAVLNTLSMKSQGKAAW